MKSTNLSILIIVVAALIAPMAAAAQSSAPTVEALMELERQIKEASGMGDAKFFEGILSDKFVMRSGGERRDKAAAVKLTAGIRCEFTGSTLDEPSLTKIDADTYVLIYRNITTGACSLEPGGTAVDLPGTPERVASVWVRSGNKWLAAFHGSNKIVDPKDASTGARAGKSKVKRLDAATRALAAVETAVWEAWKDHDRKRLERLTAESIAFVDIFGNAYANRADILDAWSSGICKVRNVAIRDAVAYTLSPTVKLLTHTGTANGTCYGATIGPIHGHSLYIRSGKTWKLAFTMNMPAI